MGRRGRNAGSASRWRSCRGRAQRERGCSPEEALFGEGSGGLLVSGERDQLESLAGDGVAVLFLGKVGGTTIEIAAGDHSLSLNLAAAEAAWRSLVA